MPNSATSNPDGRESEAATALPGRLALVVGRLNRRLAAAPGGLSHAALMSLAQVSKRESIRLSELAAIELVSAPAITRVVAELEARGLVTRGVDPDDGRAFRIQITSAGTEAILRARAARARVVTDLLAGLDSADIAAIQTALPALERLLGEP
jgi:DNA-binding MarR family transcriptional regulator